MKRGEVRVAVLHLEGSNCEDETAESFRVLGAQAEKVHLNQLTEGKVPGNLRRDLFDYHVLAVPGGFSAGDYVRAGAIFAARVRSVLGGELVKFVEEGRAVVGICNGFQVLVEMGLLPGFDATMSPEPQAVLATNDSGHYECRPCLLRFENRGTCRLTSSLSPGQILEVPAAHTEGKFLLPNEDLLRRLNGGDQVVFRYVDDHGVFAGYPWNPNGSVDNIAGICNPQGNVFALMPHPERSFYRVLHPDWTRTGAEGFGDGKLVLDGIVEYAARKG